MDYRYTALIKYLYLSTHVFATFNNFSILDTLIKNKSGLFPNYRFPFFKKYVMYFLAFKILPYFLENDLSHDEYFFVLEFMQFKF